MDNELSGCYLFESFGNRFFFYYYQQKDLYFVIDTQYKKKTILEVKTRKYAKFKTASELRQIRYYFPKPNDIGKDRYQKSVYLIQYQLFGTIPINSGSQLTLTLDDCKKIIQSSYTDLGYLLGYTDMSQSDNLLHKKAYTFIRDNGGFKKYYEITNELGINNKVYYQDYKGTFLKSSFEFIFFAIMHHNDIKYQYEPFRIKTYVPDFYIPEKKIIIEILGMTTRDNYLIRTKLKTRVYKKQGYSYQAIIVDRHHPNESIFKGCQNIFGSISKPDFRYYRKKYILTSNEFQNKLKDYLTEINEGRMKVSVRNDKSGFREKHRYYYSYALENFGTIQIAVKELIGIPSTKFKSVKVKKYWENEDYVKDEIENIFKNEKRIPTRHECYIKFRKKYNFWHFYRFWNEAALQKGGKFYAFVESLKKKFGFSDINEEIIIETKKKEEKICEIVLQLYKGNLPFSGKNSFLSEYDWANKYIQKKHGSLFDYIKQKFGYPPAYIPRPKGYYRIMENAKYELEENWKLYKRILSYSEIQNTKCKINTYRNLISIYGSNSFKNGGIFYNLILNLKKKYGYDDCIERNKNEFEKNFLLYLMGINEGKWNTKTLKSKELGNHGKKYLAHLHKKYGTVFNAVKKEIGFPSPYIVRYHNYYDSIKNCKYEIENNIKRFGCLPTRNELRKQPFLRNNTLQGVYHKWGVNQLKKGGIFYPTILKAIRSVENSRK
jgi:hypothetical protein